MFGKFAKSALILFCLSAPLCAFPPEAQKGNPWIEVSAVKTAPVFRYQVQLVDHELHIRVQTAATSPLENWILRFWIADPRMVVEKTATLTNLRENLKDYRDRIASDETNDCQKKAMRTFVKDIKEQIGKFQDYDPYLHWTVHGKESATTPVSIPPPTSHYTQGPDYSEFEGSISLDQGFDLRNPKLTGITIGIALMAPDAPPLPPPPRVSRIKFPAAIYPASISKELQSQSRLAPDSILQYKPTGYSLAVLGMANELGCFGYDGVYNVPAFWEKLELKNLSRNPDVRLYGYEYKLLIADTSRAEILDIKNYITSDGYQEYELLDFAPRKHHTYLLLQVSGPSRPLGGSSMCGAGEETDVVWLQLSKSWRIEKGQSENIDSCFHSTEVMEEGAWKNKQWEVTTDDFQDGLEKQIIYDSVHPETALQVLSKPLKEK